MPHSGDQDRSLFSAADDHSLVVAAPVLLNCWKHHGLFICHALQTLIRTGDAALEELPRQLQVIGASQMDLYLGSLFPSEISAQVLHKLHQHGYQTRESYAEWLNSRQGYATIELADQSRWVLRLGHAVDRYVHIHPGRYSPHTLRVRAPVLLSAIGAIGWAGVYGGTPDDPATINPARQRLFGLAPLRAVQHDGGFGALIHALAQICATPGTP